MASMEILVFLIIGVLAGLLGGLLGMSGGVITVPCLAFFFRINGFPSDYLMHIAIGTSLAAMVFTGIASTWAHQRRDAVRWDLVWKLMPGILVGSLLGALVAHLLTGIFLQIIFGFFALGYGIFLLFRGKREEGHAKITAWTFAWMGFLIGGLSSLLGIGGGVLTVPLLMLYSYHEKTSIGTSAATGFFITLFAALAYFYLGLGKVKLPQSVGYIYLPAFFAIGLATLIFAPIGAHWAHRLSGSLLGKIFACALIIVGILMVMR